MNTISIWHILVAIGRLNRRPMAFRLYHIEMVFMFSGQKVCSKNLRFFEQDFLDFQKSRPTRKNGRIFGKKPKIPFLRVGLDF